MNNVLVVGEDMWKLPGITGINIICKRYAREVNLFCDASRILYFLSDNNEWIPISCIIWRCQFFDNYVFEHKILDLVAYSGIKCINNVETNIRFGHNISMFKAMIDCGISINPRRYMLGLRSSSFVRPEQSVEVFKVGDYHRGYAKSIIRDMMTYQDTIDMAYCLNDLQSLEPFIEYTHDIRLLKIGESLGIYERTPSIWKANVSPTNVREVQRTLIPKYVIDQTEILAQFVGADVIGVDWVKDKSGAWYALEANLSPGIEKDDNYKDFASLL